MNNGMNLNMNMGGNGLQNGISNSSNVNSQVITPPTPVDPTTTTNRVVNPNVVFSNSNVIPDSVVPQSNNVVKAGNVPVENEMPTFNVINSSPQVDPASSVVNQTVAQPNNSGGSLSTVDPNATSVVVPNNVTKEPVVIPVEDNNQQDFVERNKNYNKDDNLFSSIDFGPLQKYLEDDNVTDISYSNGGQVWLKTLDKGVYRIDNPGVDDALVEKIAFQCSNVMGKTFNMAHPFLDSESAELRMNFVHDSIARNGIAALFRKTPAKIRLEKEKLLAEKYVSADIHDFLIKCVQGHCNIIISGETGSGKTELVKYLAAHTLENEKLITIEDTLELHLDRIFPHRDIVAMKTNNIASYSDVLVTCMRQNPKWILLSEVRSAEAVTAVRNSISSGHNILSTIHSDKAENIPHRMYSLLESNIDVDQFLKTIYRYIQLGVFVRGRYDANEKRFVREIAEVTEFYVDADNNIGLNTIYKKPINGHVAYKPVSKYLKEYLEGQGVDTTDLLGKDSVDLDKTETL